MSVSLTYEPLLLSDHQIVAEFDVAAEPTKEQIDSLLNTLGAETNKNKDKELKTQELINSLNEKYKAATEELEALKGASLTETEKVQKELELYKAQLAEKEKIIKATKVKADLASIGITGEYSDKFFNADGDIDFENLGKFIAESKDEAAKARELEIANKAGKPLSGAKPSGGDLSPQEKVAKAVAERKAANKADALKNFK